MKKIILLKGDITMLEVDAIVNAANSSLLGGGGVDGAIHKKGGPQILEECQTIRTKQGGCKTGEAVYTSAGHLPPKYVIHTVGPIWQGGNNDEAELLRKCYVNSLQVATQLKVRTIAFPNISTGVYGYPKLEAAGIAISVVKEFLETENSEIKVCFICFDEDNYTIYRQLMEHQGLYEV